MNIQVFGSPQRVNRLLNELHCLCRALLGHQGLGFLRNRERRSKNPRSKKDSRQDGNCPYPHRIDPPFTLITSPVMKVARSETAKRIGPAISSGLATRLRGIGATALF